MTTYRGTNPCFSHKWGNARRLFGEGQTHAHPLTGVLARAGAIALDVAAISSRFEPARQFGAAETYDVRRGSIAAFMRDRAGSADTVVELSESNAARHEEFHSWPSHRWDVERPQRIFMELVHHGEADARKLVSHVMPVDRAAEAFDLLDQHPSEVLQLVVEFEE